MLIVRNGIPLSRFFLGRGFLFLIRNDECGISCAYLFASPSIHGEAAALALISQSALFIPHSEFRIPNYEKSFLSPLA